MALVADFLTAGGFLRAVPGEMAILAAVVAFATVYAFTGHMSVSSTGVASLAALAAAEATATAGVAAAIAVSAIRVGAVAGDVTDLATLVALLTLAPMAAAAMATSRTTALRAVTADVAGLAASVAGLSVLRSVRTFAADMTFATAVVAFGSATVGTVACLVSSLAASEAGSSLSVEIHVGDEYAGDA